LPSNIPSYQRFVLLGFLDFDYGGDINNKKYTSTYVFNIGLGAISWSYKKQPTISLSTTKEKYRAMIVAAQDAIWLKNIMKKIGLAQSNPTRIYLDNQSAISLAKNPIYH